MRILFDISNLLNSNGGGIYYYLNGLIPSLRSVCEREGVELEFVNFYFRAKPIKIPAYIELEKLHQFYFPVRLLNKLWLYFNAPDLCKFYKGFDIVHSPHFSLPVMSSSKKVLTVHDITYLKHPEYFDPKYKKLNDYGYKQLLTANIRRADHIIAISNATRDDVLDYFGIHPGKIRTIYTGVDKPSQIPCDVARAFLAKNDLSSGKYIFFPAGTLEPRKNIQRTVDAFLATDIPHDIKLVISGVGEFARLGIEADNRIQFLRWDIIDERDILYQNSLFVVYPSLYEGFGMPLLEAMSNGRALVTSNRSSLRELAENIAVTVNPESVDELKGAFEKLFHTKSKQSYERLSIERAQEFSWRGMAEQTLDIYRSLVDS